MTGVHITDTRQDTWRHTRPREGQEQQIMGDGPIRVREVEHGRVQEFAGYASGGQGFGVQGAQDGILGVTPIDTSSKTLLEDAEPFINQGGQVAAKHAGEKLVCGLLQSNRSVHRASLAIRDCRRLADQGGTAITPWLR